MVGANVRPCFSCLEVTAFCQIITYPSYYPADDLKSFLRFPEVLVARRLLVVITSAILLALDGADIDGDHLLDAMFLLSNVL